MRSCFFIAFFTAMASFPLKAQNKAYFIELPPLNYIQQGLGISLGTENGHFQYGLSFNSFNTDFFKTGIIDVSGSVQTIRQLNFSSYTNFYFTKSRKWLYLGLALMPNWTEIIDDISKENQWVLSASVMPRIGLRWFPLKRVFYLGAEYGLNIPFYHQENMVVGMSSVDFEGSTGRPNFYFGFRF